MEDSSCELVMMQTVTLSDWKGNAIDSFLSRALSVLGNVVSAAYSYVFPLMREWVPREVICANTNELQSGHGAGRRVVQLQQQLGVRERGRKGETEAAPRTAVTPQAGRERNHRPRRHHHHHHCRRGWREEAPWLLRLSNHSINRSMGNKNDGDGDACMHPPHRSPARWFPFASTSVSVVDFPSCDISCTWSSVNSMQQQVTPGYWCYCVPSVYHLPHVKGRLATFGHVRIEWPCNTKVFWLLLYSPSTWFSSHLSWFPVTLFCTDTVMISPAFFIWVTTQLSRTLISLCACPWVVIVYERTPLYLQTPCNSMQPGGYLSLYSYICIYR